MASDISLKLDHTRPTRLSRDGKGDINEDDINTIFENLEADGNEALALQNVAEEKRSSKRSVEVRFIRQSKNLTIPYKDSIRQLINDFLSIYAKRYGDESIPESAGIELVTFVVDANGSLSRPQIAHYVEKTHDASDALRGSRKVYEIATGEFVDTPVYDGELLNSGNQFQGPAIVEYGGTTISVISGQQASVDNLKGISIKSVKI